MPARPAVNESSDGPPLGTSPRATRHHVAADWVWWVALVPFALALLHHWTWPPADEAGDYAQYLLHAKALVELRPYIATGYIFHPAAWVVGPPTYPPGLPLTLAPLVAVGGVHSPLIPLLMPLSLLLFAWCAYRHLTMYVPRWPVGAAIAMTLLAIEGSGYTRVPISDPGFCALVWGCLWAADTRTDWRWRQVAMVTVLGFGAMGYRIAGLALVPALMLHALLTWPNHRGRAFIPAAIWAAAGVVVLSLGGGAGATPSINSLGELPNWIVFAAQLYKGGFFDIELHPVSSNLASDLYHLVASMVAVVGVAGMFWRMRTTLLAAFGAAYAIMLVAVPVAEPRYLWPFFPVIAAGLVWGAQGIARWLIARRAQTTQGGRRVSLAVGVVVTAVMLGALWQQWRQPAPHTRLASTSAASLFAWLREQQGRTPMRVVYENPRVVTLESGVPAMGDVARSPNGHLAAYREMGITHLIVDRDGGGDCLQRIANHLPISHPDQFALAYENAAFRVYRFQTVPGEVGPFQPINYARIEQWCEEHPNEISPLATAGPS
ncbi:MAG: hypothetical protein U0132_02645 [Gemmatimonadaceae bacterium]